MNSNDQWVGQEVGQRDMGMGGALRGDLSTSLPGGFAVDGSGNSYVASSRNSGTLDLPGTEHDQPSRRAAFFFSLDTDGNVRWAQDVYADDANSVKLGGHAVGRQRAERGDEDELQREQGGADSRIRHVDVVLDL